jgi:hypothetical protein
MKVIVKVPGFYGGTWFEAGHKPQEMPDGIAKAFLPPYGDTIDLPATAAQQPIEKPATRSNARQVHSSAKKEAD